jgi:hypothetical protein
LIELLFPGYIPANIFGLRLKPTIDSDYPPRSRISGDFHFYTCIKPVVNVLSFAYLLCMKFLSKLIFVGFTGLFAYSCAEHNIPIVVDCERTDVVKYSTEVDIIVQTVCAVSGCHNGDNGEDRNWEEFEKFQSHSAEVRRRITLPGEHPDHMPRKGSLTKAQLQAIICWIDQGAQAN